MNQHTVYSEVSNLVGNIETLLQSYLEEMDGKLKNGEVKEIKTFLHYIDSKTRTVLNILLRFMKLPCQKLLWTNSLLVVDGFRPSNKIYILTQT